MLADPRRGKDIAEEENKYLLEHFDHFELGYEWPHTVLIGGGQQKTFKNKEELKKILQNNPEACYVWGDHQQ